MINGATKQDKIITLAELLKKNLTIPSYQRAYEWEKKNVFTLIDDIYKHFIRRKTSAKEEKNVNLGAIILYQNKDTFEIVDGQQRLITLSLLIKALSDDYDNQLLNNPILCVANTETRIINNYAGIKEYIGMLAKSEDWDVGEEFRRFLENDVNFYVLQAKTQDEAFQLFDGRNSKYKDLTPIDLLKAYHLGALNDNILEKQPILKQWDKNIKTSFAIDDSCNKIEYLYNNILFNVYNWSLNKPAKPFSKEDVYLYKGFKEGDKYAYVEYCRNNRTHQANKPFKSGKDFFITTNEYIKALDSLIKKYNLEERITTEVGVVDGYNHRFRRINYLYYGALFAFFDRFGYKIKSVYIDMIEDFIFKYSILLRVKNASVSRDSLNSYILKPEKTRYNFFFECNNALSVEELLKLENANYGDRPNEGEKVGAMRGKLWDYLFNKTKGKL